MLCGLGYSYHIPFETNNHEFFICHINPITCCLLWSIPVDRYIRSILYKIQCNIPGILKFTGTGVNNGVHIIKIIANPCSNNFNIAWRDIYYAIMSKGANNNPHG